MPLASPSTRPVTVRLSQSSRDQLDVLATLTDRPLAQLVRYALLDFLPDDPADTPETLFTTSRIDGDTRHLTVRLPHALVDALDAAAGLRGVTASDVIREAVETWLGTAPAQALGTPTSRMGR